MISVLFNWLYIAVTTFLAGAGVAAFVRKTFRYHIKDISCMMALGLLAVTVYAQVFSLFYKVGAAANVVLAAVCLVTAFALRRETAGLLSGAWKQKGTAWKLAVLLSVAVWCFCTSRGYMHYDSDLYHAQSIRWIEEYGIVKGLGNIHVRFAYNSSFFALSALYSMKFLTGRSLHTVNGLVALLLWIQVLPLFERDQKGHKKTLVTSFARLGAFYYLTVIYSDVVSPASDYAIMCVVFFIVIRWLELLERGEDSAVPYALLCVAGVYAVTLKLTAGLILLLLAKPASMLIRQKRWRDIGIYLMMGVVTVAPWLARTVLLSGYLLYPFPSLDLFDVDWKINAASAALDAAEIRTWGRGLNNAALVDLPVTQWFPGWFQGSLPMTGKVLVLAAIVSLLVFAVLSIRFFCNIRDTDVPAEKLWKKQMLVLATVAASYGFWQFSAPLLRYGYAYVLLVVMITAGILCDNLIKYFDKWQKKDMIRKMAVLGVLMLWAFSAVKLVSLVRYCCGEIRRGVAGGQAYVWQQDYGDYALESYEVDGVTFYYPVSGDRTGYDSFPAVPGRIPVRFRGASVEEGFYPGEGNSES